MQSDARSGEKNENLARFILFTSTFQLMIFVCGPNTSILFFFHSEAMLRRHDEYGLFAWWILFLISSRCEAAAPFAPFGVASGDTQLPPGLDDWSYGPYPLPAPMRFPDGGIHYVYYVSSNGLLSFNSTSSFSLSPVYYSSIGRMISASYGDIETPRANAPGGMYHRVVNRSTSNRNASSSFVFSSLWSDVLSPEDLQRMPFQPQHALIYTLDRCPYFSLPNTTMTSQVVALWSDDAVGVLLTFRVANIMSSYLLFGGYVGPTQKFLFPGPPTQWPNRSFSVMNTANYRANDTSYLSNNNTVEPGVFVVFVTNKSTATVEASVSATIHVASQSLTIASRSSSSTRSTTIIPMEMLMLAPPAVTVKSIAQVSSGIGAALAVVAAAPSSGFAVDRLTTLSGFGDCDDAVRPTVQNLMTNGVPTFLDAPLQLSFGDEFGASQRGTVFGNLLVFIIVGIVSLAAVAVHRGCGMGTSRQMVLPSHTYFDKALMLQSAAALRLPGATIVIVVLLLDSLVASSVLLVGYGTNANDIALGAFGLLVVTALFLATCYVLDPRPLSFLASEMPLEQFTVSDELILAHGLRTQIGGWWDRIKTPSNKWEPRQFRKGNSLFVEHFGYLFEGCRGGRHWWILVEITTTIVVSTMSGIVPETESACRTKAWIALALMSVVLVACVAAWPMNTHIETGTAIVLLCAQVVVIACAIGGVGNVADIIGLSVSISSAAVALFPIAWWMISLLQTCSSWNNNKKAPSDLLLDMRLRCLSTADLSTSNNMLRRDSDFPPDKARCIAWTRELVVTSESFRQQQRGTSSDDSLQLMIELICDTRRTKTRGSL